MTHTEKKQLPLGVGDDVRSYDDGSDGHPEKWVTGKVIEAGDHSFIVQWDDLEDETYYEWQEVTVEGNIILENLLRKRCPECNGEGTVPEKRGGNEGVPESDVEFVCSECKGTGKIK